MSVQSILDKLLSGAGEELTTSIFDNLSDQELAYLADVNNIGEGRTREELVDVLLVVLKELKSSQEKMRSGKLFEFSVENGNSYSINVEYLYEHVFIENQRNVPFRDEYIPGDVIKRLQKEYDDHMYELRNQGAHIAVVNSKSLVFRDASSMMQYCKNRHMDYVNNLFAEVSDPADVVPVEIFYPNEFKVENLTVVDDKYFYVINKDNKGSIEATANVNGKDLILMNDSLISIQDADENVAKKIAEHADSFEVLRNLENLTEDQITDMLEEVNPLIGFYCLFSSLYPELVENIVSKGYNIPMYDFCYEGGVDEQSSLYRAVVVICLCTGDPTYTNVQKICSEIPNNPFFFREYEEMDNIVAEAIVAIKNFVYLGEADPSGNNSLPSYRSEDLPRYSDQFTENSENA